MATNIPPHNLRIGRVAVLNYVIDNYDQIDDLEIEDLMRFLRALFPHRAADRR